MKVTARCTLFSRDITGHVTSPTIIFDNLLRRWPELISFKLNKDFIGLYIDFGEDC